MTADHKYVIQYDTSVAKDWLSPDFDTYTEARAWISHWLRGDADVFNVRLISTRTIETIQVLEPSTW